MEDYPYSLRVFISALVNLDKSLRDDMFYGSRLISLPDKVLNKIVTLLKDYEKERK